MFQMNSAQNLTRRNSSRYLEVDHQQRFRRPRPARMMLSLKPRTQLLSLCTRCPMPMVHFKWIPFPSSRFVKTCWRQRYRFYHHHQRTHLFCTYNTISSKSRFYVRMTFRTALFWMLAPQFMLGLVKGPQTPKKHNQFNAHKVFKFHIVRSGSGPTRWSNHPFWIISMFQTLFKLKSIQIGHPFIELSKELSPHHLSNISLHGAMLECPIIDWSALPTTTMTAHSTMTSIRLCCMRWRRAVAVRLASCPTMVRAMLRCGASRTRMLLRSNQMCSAYSSVTVPTWWNITMPTSAAERVSLFITGRYVHCTAMGWSQLELRVVHVIYL